MDEDQVVSTLDGSATTETEVPQQPAQDSFGIDLNRSTQESRPFTDNDILAYLSTKTHDELKHLPAYNSQVQRGLAKIQNEQAHMVEEYQALAQWDNWFGQLNPQQFRQAMGNPEYADIAARVTRWRAEGAPNGVLTRQVVAEQMISQIQQYLSGHDELRDLVDNWDELLQEKDFAKFVGKLVDHGTGKKTAAKTAALEKEARAQMAQILQAHHISLPVPALTSELPVSGSGPIQGWTRDRYLNASPEEVSMLTPAQIDKILST